MGIYNLIANLDKREYIDPHALGTGAKDYELPYRAGPALLCLLRYGRWSGDRIAVFADTGDDYSRIEGGGYDREGVDQPAFKDISDEALSAFRERFLVAPGDIRLSPFADRHDTQRRHGPWFRYFDPDDPKDGGTAGWMRGWLAMHDPEAAAREQARDDHALVEWLRAQGNRYEGLSARETLSAIITDIEAGEHKPKESP